MLSKIINNCFSYGKLNNFITSETSHVNFPIMKVVFIKEMTLIVCACCDNEGVGNFKYNLVLV